MARLMQRQPDRRLANILQVMSGGETVLGAIDAGDGLEAPGGGISNGGLGSDSGVLSTYDRGGALAAGVSDGVQNMGSGVLGGAMGSGGIQTSSSGLRRIIRGYAHRRQPQWPPARRPERPRQRHKPGRSVAKPEQNGAQARAISG
jgi:hypothetical protein